MHPSGDMDNISGNADTCSGTGVRSSVHASGLRATGNIVEEWSVHDHLCMGIADT